MKTSSYACTLRRGSLAVFAVGIFIGSGFGQPTGLDVNVRASVETPARKKSAKPTAELKKFAIFPATEVASPEKMVRSVAPATLNEVYAIVQEKMIQQGFVGVQPKERPEILVTIRYGRGFLTNPWATGGVAANDSQSDYVGDGGGHGGGRANGATTASAPRTSVTGLPGQFEPGLEAKRQAAVQEKLFFTVEAFDFESMQKGNKAVKLWSTTVNVDDPDHRDLNQTFRQMLTAAGDYFGKKTKEAEVEIPTTVRDGRVEIGTARVVADPKPATK